MGTITSYEDLAAWFRGNFQSGGDEGGSSGRTSPYWTLYSVGYGTRDSILATNADITNQEKSLEHLINNIKMVNNPGGHTFRVYQTWKPRHNHPTAEVNVQIVQGATTQPAAPATINGIPEGMVAIGELDRRIKEALEKKDMEYRLEQLEAQVKAGPEEDFTEKVITGIERISATPLGGALIAKIMGVDPSQIQATVGHLAPQQPGDPSDDTTSVTFEENLEVVCHTLGTDEESLMLKLRLFAEQNPGMARQLFNQ